MQPLSACAPQPARPNCESSSGQRVAQSDTQSDLSSLPLWLSKGEKHGLGCCSCAVTDNRKHSGMQDMHPGSSQQLLGARHSHRGTLGRGVGKGRRGCGPEWAVVGTGKQRRAVSGTRTTERLMSDLFIFLQLCVIDLSDLGQFGSVI